MEVKKMKFVRINTFIHLSGSSTEILNSFKSLFESNIITKNNTKLIKIEYDTAVGSSLDIPVKIFFNNHVAIFLNLTAGYMGESPKILCDIVKMCLPNHDEKIIENDILTSQKYVNISYSPDTSMSYQFALDKDFYYSW